MHPESQRHSPAQFFLLSLTATRKYSDSSKGQEKAVCKLRRMSAFDSMRGIIGYLSIYFPIPPFPMVDGHRVTGDLTRGNERPDGFLDSYQ